MKNGIDCSIEIPLRDTKSNHSVSIFSCEAKAISEKQDTSILRSEGGERRRAVGLSVELSSAYCLHFCLCFKPGYSQNLSSGITEG